MKKLRNDPVVHALLNDNTAKMRELVQNGEDIGSAFFRAAFHDDIGNIEIAEMLLREFKANPNFIHPLYNDIPIMHVKSIAMLNLLLYYEAEINSQIIKGETALIQMITAWPRPEIVFYTMIKAGADINIKDKEGKSALDYAIEKRSYVNTSTDEGKYLEILYKDIITILIKAGAK
ncbi:MAG: hypothetical protein ISN64_00270 [Rickettsia sp.]|nr:hypothetical protein [Rickettsia sp.]